MTKNILKNDASEIDSNPYFLLPILEGMHQGWQKASSQYANKRLGFAGRSGPRIADHPANVPIKIWFCTFNTEKPFEKPLTKWESIVSYVFNVDAYLHYKALETNQPMLENCIQQLNGRTNTYRETVLDKKDSFYKTIRKIAKKLFSKIQKNLSRLIKEDQENQNNNQSTETLLEYLKTADNKIQEKGNQQNNELNIHRRTLGYQLGKLLSRRHYQQQQTYLKQVEGYVSMSSKTTLETPDSVSSGASDQAVEDRSLAIHLPSAQESNLTPPAALLNTTPPKKIAQAKKKPKPTSTQVTKECFIHEGNLEQITPEEAFSHDLDYFTLFDIELKIRLLDLEFGSAAFIKAADYYQAELSRTKRLIMVARYHPDKHQNQAEKCAQITQKITQIEESLYNLRTTPITNVMHKKRAQIFLKLSQEDVLKDIKRRKRKIVARGLAQTKKFLYELHLDRLNHRKKMNARLDKLIDSYNRMLGTAENIDGTMQKIEGNMQEMLGSMREMLGIMQKMEENQNETKNSLRGMLKPLQRIEESQQETINSQQETLISQKESQQILQKIMQLVMTLNPINTSAEVLAQDEKDKASIAVLTSLQGPGVLTSHHQNQDPQINTVILTSSSL